MFFASIFWNPDSVAFTLPFLGHPVRWYGLLFAFGFLGGYFITRSIFTKRLTPRDARPEDRAAAAKKAHLLTDQLVLYFVLGAIIGARLGDVFFYDWPYYKHHLEQIPMVWKGGLASHGGAVGILIALMLFRRKIKENYPQFSFLVLLDTIVIPTAMVGTFIRIGNFVSQEILGTESSLPWAVVFGNPIDGRPGIPRHPVQLYEAVYYLAVFVVLMTMWRRKGSDLREGTYVGWFFLLIFAFRFVIEWFKLPQGIVEPAFISTGQLLSVPFIIAGIYLLKRKSLRRVLN